MNENLFFFLVLRSNMKMTNMMITKLALLCCSLKFTLKLALKFIINASENFCDNNFLWLHKAVKHQHKLVLIEESYKSRHFSFQTLD